MKALLRILSYAKNYKVNALLNVLFNLFSTLFSLFSLAMVIPFLNIIFLHSTTDYASIIAKGKPKLEASIDSISDVFNYELAARFMEGENGKSDALIFLCSLIVTMFFFKNLTRYFALYFIAPLRNGIMLDLRNKTYAKIVTLPLSYFSEEKKGDIISRISGDAQEIEWTVLQSLEMIFRDPINIIVFLASMLYMSPQLTLFVFIFLPLSGLIVGKIGKSLKETSAEGQQKIGQLIAMVEETLTGMRIIQAFNGEKRMVDSFNSQNGLYNKLMIKMYRKRDLASPISEFLGVIIMVGVIWFGGNLVLDNDVSLSASAFIAYIALFSQIISPAKALTTAYYNIQKGAASEERIQAILNAEEVITSPSNPQKITNFEREITFENVWFKYKESDVLKNISFSLEKGKSIALVGASGGGKSTIADLIPRFYDPYQGAISIDSYNLKDLDLKQIRNLLGIVTQDSILFNTSIYENIAFGKPSATKEEVVAAAKIANAHAFIEASEEGYNTNIGDGGNKLSGGQKQRISIARAILKNPPILILDEATSALDTESEKLVQEALSNLMKNRTSLIIAHRLSTIQNADEILVLQNGEIVERGSHANLITKNGVYKKLSELQTFK